MSYLESLENFNSAMEAQNGIAEGIKQITSFRNTDKLNALTEQINLDQVEGLKQDAGDKVAGLIQQGAGAISGVIGALHSFNLLNRALSQGQQIAQKAQTTAKQLTQPQEKPENPNASSDTTEATEEGATEEGVEEGTQNSGFLDNAVEQAYQRAVQEQGGEPLRINPEDGNELYNFKNDTETGEDIGEEAAQEGGELGGELSELAPTVADTVEAVAPSVISTVSDVALAGGVAVAPETLGSSLLVGGLIASIATLGSQLYEDFKPHHNSDETQIKADQSQIQQIKNQLPTIGNLGSAVGFGMTSALQQMPSLQDLF